MGRPFSVVGTVTPDQSVRSDSSKQLPLQDRSYSRNNTPSRNPITGEIMSPSTPDILARPYSIAVGDHRPEVPPLDLDITSMVIEDGTSTVNGDTEEEVFAEEAAEEEGAPPAEEEVEPEAEPEAEPEPQQSAVEKWQEIQMSMVVAVSETKFPENEKEMKTTCEARLAEDLARGTYEECDRMRTATSRPMSARAEARAGGTPTTPNTYKPQPLGHQVKSLHESSLKMKVQNSAEFMNQKIRFTARAVNATASRESLRTLCGYFFPSDGSMTVYEFKQLKRTNVAHHYIDRGVHWHHKGPRKGGSYTVHDICVGENLTFFPGDHPTLPEALGKDTSLTLRITSVDLEAKKKCLQAMAEGQPPAEEELLTVSLSEEEAEQRVFLHDLQQTLSSQLAGRAVRTLVGILNLFMKADLAANNDLTCTVGKDDIAGILKDFHVAVPNEGDLDALLTAIDETDPFACNYLHVLDALTGGLNEGRVSYVRRAFDKVDMDKRGVINFMNLKKFANPKLSEEMQLFEVYDKKILQAGIGFAQFATFYLGASMEQEQDADFVKLVKEEWCLLGC